MKGMMVFGFLCIVGACGAMWMAGSSISKDQGHLIAFACGNDASGVQEIQIAVSFRMTRLDPPKRKPDGRLQTARDWLKDHFELSDASGAVVELKNSDFANLIPEAKVGTPAYYAVGLVKANTAYTFDYFPIGRAESKTYRVKFSTDAKGKPFQRKRFAWTGQ